MLRPRRSAFTLLELLIVIGVIGILMALALAIGARVAVSGKENRTGSTIRVLDTILNDYVSRLGGIPPPTVVDPRLNNNPPVVHIQPIMDGVVLDPTGTTVDSTINSVGLFLVQARDAAGGDAMLKGLDTRFVRSFDADAPDSSPGAPDWTTQPELLTVFDAWQRPIRYVHPRFGGLLYGPWPTSSDPNSPILTADVLGPAPAGRQYGITGIRRNGTAQTGDPDSDGGMPRGGTPYFYSAGPDGKVGRLVDSAGAILEDYNEDNVYTLKPEFTRD